jgi:hypothetical protein
VPVKVKNRENVGLRFMSGLLVRLPLAPSCMGERICDVSLIIYD